MKKSEFFNLPATRKGLNILEKEFTSSNNIFFNEVARSLRTYIQLPASVKRAVRKFNFEETYLNYVKVKNIGLRKDLILPF